LFRLILIERKECPHKIKYSKNINYKNYEHILEVALGEEYKLKKFK